MDEIREMVRAQKRVEASLISFSFFFNVEKLLHTHFRAQAFLNRTDTKCRSSLFERALVCTVISFFFYFEKTLSPYFSHTNPQIYSLYLNREVCMWDNINFLLESLQWLYCIK